MSDQADKELPDAEATPSADAQPSSPAAQRAVDAASDLPAELAGVGDLDDLPDDFDDDDDLPELDEVDVKDLLRSALKAPPARTSLIRRGIQDRIRNESRGRFFADGWSRTSAPKATFLVTTLLMLLLTLLAWAFLSPIGMEVFGG